MAQEPSDASNHGLPAIPAVPFPADASALVEASDTQKEEQEAAAEEGGEDEQVE